MTASTPSLPPPTLPPASPICACRSIRSTSSCSTCSTAAPHVAELVGEVKKREGTPVVPSRSRGPGDQKMQQSNAGPLKSLHVAAIWREIMSACLALESPQRVAVLGPDGTFCEQAAVEYFGGAARPDLLRQLRRGLPRHRSRQRRSTAWCRCRELHRRRGHPLARPVPALARSTWSARSACWCATTCCARDNSLEGIEAVLAHPQALAQCQTWLTKHLPHAERRAVSSNAEGARLAAGNPAWAGHRQRARGHANSGCTSSRMRSRTMRTTAPASPSSACPRRWPCRQASGQRLHQPGGLGAQPARRRARHAGAAEAHGVSMTRFESRPARSGQWEYYFYIDLRATPRSPTWPPPSPNCASCARSTRCWAPTPSTRTERMRHVRTARPDRLRPDGRLLRAGAQARRLVKRVVGYSKSPSTTERARQLGVIDVAAPSALLAVSGADMCCSPCRCRATEATFKAIRHLVTQDMLVMDVGSTKGDVVEAARRVPARPLRLASCPPTRSPARKWPASSMPTPTLYAGRQVDPDADRGDPAPNVQRADAGLGGASAAKVLTMTPEAHDAAFAAVSHLPHLLAFALINAITASPQGTRLPGAGRPGLSRLHPHRRQRPRDVARHPAGQPRAGAAAIARSSSAACSHVKLMEDGRRARPWRTLIAQASRRARTGAWASQGTHAAATSARSWHRCSPPPSSTFRRWTAPPAPCACPAPRASPTACCCWRRCAAARPPCTTCWTPTTRA